jgi:hypothetical protein
MLEIIKYSASNPETPDFAWLPNFEPSLIRQEQHGSLNRPILAPL